MVAQKEACRLGRTSNTRPFRSERTPDRRCPTVHVHLAHDTPRPPGNRATRRLPLADSTGQIHVGRDGTHFIK